jgi:hypothetical protein
VGPFNSYYFHGTLQKEGDDDRPRTGIRSAPYTRGDRPFQIDYFLRDERPVMNALVADIARGAFTYAPPAVDQLARAMEIDNRYSDLGLGLVDASIVVLAEDLGIRRLATRDVRHFAAVRLRDGTAFDLVVYPTNPEE